MTPSGPGSSKSTAKPSRGEKTRLQQFLDAHGITSAQLEVATGIARQSMTKIRAGRDVRRNTMLRILCGLRALVGPTVQMGDLFDLEPDDPESGR